MQKASEPEGRETEEDVVSQVVVDLIDEMLKEESKRGVWYIEPKQGEPNGFDMGWTVDVVHALPRIPQGGRKCIVKFKEAELSQMIDPEIVRQKAPRELLIFLHKKLGLRV